MTSRFGSTWEEFAMSTGQKQAWFSLTVVLVTVGGVLALAPVLGVQKAQGSLGLLGFWGLTPFLFRKRPGEIVVDERDGLILLRSSLIGYSVFWVVFALTCMLAAFSYESGGGVPVV